MTGQQHLRNRPAIMALFSRMLFFAIACNVLAILFHAGRFRADAIAAGQAAAGWFVSIVLVAAIYSLLWWRIARRAGNVARWVFIVLSAPSILAAPKIYRLSVSYGWSYGLLMAFSYALIAVCIVILLRRDVSRWLRSRGRIGEIDPGVFA